MADSSCSQQSRSLESWLSLSTVTSGLATARSSVYSWGWANDDFERNAAAQVQKHFDAVDDTLYGTPLDFAEDRSKFTAAGHDWSSFPQLRIVGVQQVAAEEAGFEELDLSFDSSLQNLKLQSKTTSGDNFSIKGFSMGIQADSSAVHDEIFAQDGNYEELLAFDESEGRVGGKAGRQSNKQSGRARRQKMGLPPVTPMCAARDTVLRVIFDHIWSQVVGEMQELISKCYHTHTSRTKLPHLVSSSNQPPWTKSDTVPKSPNLMKLPATAPTQGLFRRLSDGNIGGTLEAKDSIRRVKSSVVRGGRLPLQQPSIAAAPAPARKPVPSDRILPPLEKLHFDDKRASSAKVHGSRRRENSHALRPSTTHGTRGANKQGKANGIRDRRL